MDLGWLDFGWKVAWTLINVIGWVWMILSNRDKATNTRMTELHNQATGKIETVKTELSKRVDSLEDVVDQKVDVHAERITSLEGIVKNGPTHDDLGKIYERLAGVEHRLGDRIDNVNGAIKRIEGENVSQTRILNLVYESLINRSKP